MADADDRLPPDAPAAPPPAAPPPAAMPAPPGPRLDPDLIDLPRHDFDGPETTDLEIAPAQFQLDAIENNYWWLHERRRHEKADAVLAGFARAVYGETPDWLNPAARTDVPGYQPGDYETARLKGIEKLFADAANIRTTNVGAGELANFPTDFAALEAQAAIEASRELDSERQDALARLSNRSDPNLTGGAASFLGSMAAGVSDAEGVALLPFGAGGGASLGRTILIESALGGAGAALQIPAQQKQAERLGYEAADPVLQVLGGFAFGAALPIGGRALRLGANTLTAAGRAENRDLLRLGTRPGAEPAERGAANSLARDTASRDTAPAGLDRDGHAAALDRAETGLVSDRPDMVRPDDVIPTVDATAVKPLPPIGPDAPENWQAIRGGIFAGESGGDYNALYSFSNRPGGPFENIKLTEMTVDQAIEFSNPQGAYAQWVKNRIGRVATPMGAYQIVGTTLRAAKEGLGLTGDELMDEALQERLGIWIYRAQGTGAWEGYRGPRPGFAPLAQTGGWRDAGSYGRAADVLSFDPRNLQTDAAAYQYKMGGDEYGVTGRLTGERVWDARAAIGVIVHERLDGSLFIADGHQRLGLARRLMADGQDGITLQGYVFREAEGYGIEDVRTLAALKNIRQESGTALDAAKVLRDHPELMGEMGSRSRSFMLQAQGLADLAPGPFQAVVNQVVPENYGALVGRIIPDDEKLQSVALAALKKTDPANETQAESVVRDIRRLGLERKADEAQMDLFGEGFDLKRTVISERMKVTDAVIKAARANRAIFTKLEKEADTIQEAGNVLDRTANLSRAEAAERTLARFLILANEPGPVRDALDAAARAYRSGTKLDDAVDQVTRALDTATAAPAGGTVADGAGRGGAEGAALTAPRVTDLPAEGDARLQPGLFDDPVEDRAEIARLARDEADLALALQQPGRLPDDMEIELDLFGDGPSTLPLRDATARLAEEADFVDALKTICLKG